MGSMEPEGEQMTELFECENEDLSIRYITGLDDLHQMIEECLNALSVLMFISTSKKDCDSLMMIGFCLSRAFKELGDIK